MNEWKFKWMNEWMKVQMNKWMNEWTNVWSLIWNDYKHIDNIQMFNDKEYANIWKWKVHSLFSTMIQVYADMFHLPTTYTNHQIWNLQNARLNNLYSHTYYVHFFLYISCFNNCFHIFPQSSLTILIWAVNTKGFQLLLCSIALRTLSLSHTSKCNENGLN